MTTSITPDYYFITALPTPTWVQVLRFCQSQPKVEGQLSMYYFEAQAGLTIDVKPLDANFFSHGMTLSGTFFSERYHQHSLSDVVEAVREGSLDPKVLTYPELLSGQDTMIVFFWPDEGRAFQEGLETSDSLPRKADDLFETLVTATKDHS